MKSRRTQYTVSYRVLDSKKHCVDVIKVTGPNKRYLLWKVERIVLKKHGKGFTVHQSKIVEETP